MYGQTKNLAIDLGAKSVAGAFALDVYPVYENIDLGVLRTEGRVDHHTIALTKITGERIRSE